MIASSFGIEEALLECGVTAATLPAGEKDVLDRSGWIVVPGLVDPAWLERLRANFEAAAPETSTATGTRHASELKVRDPELERALFHPRVLAAVHHVLRRPFQVFTVGGRDPQRGFGRQGLHADWLPRGPGEAFSVVTATWVLDGFTTVNGATRFVPGSHLQPGPVPKSLAVPASRHPRELVATAPAGAGIVFNGHLWHGGTENRSGERRRTIQVQYVARERVPPSFEAPFVPDGAAPALRYLLGR